MDYENKYIDIPLSERAINSDGDTENQYEWYRVNTLYPTGARFENDWNIQDASINVLSPGNYYKNGTVIGAVIPDPLIVNSITVNNSASVGGGGLISNGDTTINGNFNVKSPGEYLHNHLPFTGSLPDPFECANLITDELKFPTGGSCNVQSELIATNAINVTGDLFSSGVLYEGIIPDPLVLDEITVLNKGTFKETLVHNDVDVATAYFKDGDPLTVTPSPISFGMLQTHDMHVYNLTTGVSTVIDIPYTPGSPNFEFGTTLPGYLQYIGSGQRVLQFDCFIQYQLSVKGINMEFEIFQNTTISHGKAQTWHFNDPELNKPVSMCMTGCIPVAVNDGDTFNMSIKCIDSNVDVTVISYHFSLESCKRI